MDVVLIIGAIASIYFAGLLAEHRGRSFRTWAWIAALIGPFAFVVFLLPNRRSRNGEQA
jgi:MFS family permease